MRKCAEYEDMISAFIDGALAEEDRAALMEHMASCPACQNYFDQQIALHDALLADAEAIRPPENFTADVMARVRFTSQEKRRKPAWPRWAALAACCAIAALALWRGGFGMRQVNVTGSTADVCPATAEDCGEIARSAQKNAAPVQEAAPEERDTALEEQGTAPEIPTATLNSAPPPDEMIGGGGSAAEAETQAAPQLDSAPQTADTPAGERKVVTEQRTAGDGGAMTAGAPPVGTAPAAADTPASHDGTSLLSIEPEAAKAPRTILTASPAAAAWVEETLGLAWTAGEFYELTAEEYGQLREALEADGADFTEQPGDEGTEEFVLIAGNSPETDE